jgi:sporadic carbohydrate cluster protein (TIGR04323 family)
MSGKGTKAYTTPRAFGGFQIPISLQSAAIRRYCEERGLSFHLHANENLIPNTYLVLESVVADAASYEGIAMCSTDMLPTDSRHRRDLVQRCLTAGCRLHFLFEQRVVATTTNADELETLISLGMVARTDVARRAELQALARLI